MMHEQGSCQPYCMKVRTQRWINTNKSVSVDRESRSVSIDREKDYSFLD